MAEAVLGLGGNLGARRALFAAAIALLDALPRCRVLARSRLYETPPLGPPQPDYLNAAVRVSWDGPPVELWRETQRVEARLGRQRRVRWGARTLDVDLLHWSEGEVRLPELEVPHRELGRRPFALAPLLEVRPDLHAAWEARLVELGGAPPLAEPGWPILAPEGEFTVSSWTHDVAEVAALGLDLCARVTRPDAHALATRTFDAGRELGPAELAAYFVAALAEVARGGFAACGAAVTSGRGEHLRGVWLGEPSAGAGSVPPLEVHVERRADGAQRVRMRGSAPDHGPRFDESGTM